MYLPQKHQAVEMDVNNVQVWVMGTSAWVHMIRVEAMGFQTSRDENPKFPSRGKTYTWHGKTVAMKVISRLFRILSIKSS